MWKIILGSDAYSRIDWGAVGWEDIIMIMVGLLRWSLVIVSAIGTIYIVWAAVGYFGAQGDEEKIKKSRQSITLALIGIGVVVAAYLIIGETWKFFSSKPFEPTVPKPLDQTEFNQVDTNDNPDDNPNADVPSPLEQQ